MSTGSAWARWWYSRQQRTQFAQAGRDHVEHAALRIGGHFLLQAGSDAPRRAAFDAYLAVVGR